MPSVSLHGELLSNTAGRYPLERVHELGKLDHRRVLDQEEDVIVIPVTLGEFAIEIGTHGDQYRSHVVEQGPGEHPVNRVLACVRSIPSLPRSRGGSRDGAP